jgi:large subunit ribosomal protein L9
MKVILLKDVPKIGRKHEVKEVPDGHALNFLLPRGFVERATADALKRLEMDKAKHALKTAESEAAFLHVLKEADAVSVNIFSEANAEGHLYRAVQKDKIVRAFKEKGMILEERSIHLENPIKSLGEHTITLSSQGKEGKVRINVTRA